MSDTEETDENIEIEEEVKDVDGAGDAMVTDDGTEEEDTFVCVLDGINQRDISLIECTFCGVIADTIAENMTHMESKHSFFLPRFGRAFHRVSDLLTFSVLCLARTT